jgi:exodeoxyribonuclease V gamma subunit
MGEACPTGRARVRSRSLMRLYESNRLEELVRALAEVVGRPLCSPLAPEVVVVQSRGMERWVSLELAGRFGVWSNARFPFPRTFVENTLATVLGEPVPEVHAYRRECLLWAVFRRWSEFMAHPAFTTVKAYLSGDPRDQKRYELASRVSALFDQYPVYRPEMVLGWDAGEDHHWQAVLWRSVVAEYGPHHLAARLVRFGERWPKLEEATLSRLPERVSVFGVSSLPPSYAEFVAALSHRIEVHVFRLSAAPDPPSGSESEHPLAKSLGRVGREFGQVLDAVAGADIDRISSYRQPGTQSRLAGLQAELLGGRRDAERQWLPEGADDSLTIHACHSPVRELEVLRDQLIRRFEQDPSLLPHQVLVMTPDLETYAPLVDAVFEVDPKQPGYIPYRVADRTAHSVNRLVEVLLRLLDLVDGRITASSVIELLEVDAVRRRFGVPTEALGTLVRWIQESGVRWGEDARDRADRGLPAADQNTWHFGLARLLLGYAMDTSSAELFQGVLPVEGIEGADTEWLGRLAELCSVLFASRRALSAARSPRQWQASITALCEALLDPNETHGFEFEPVRDALEALGESAELAGFSQAIELDLVRQWLAERLSSQPMSQEFLTGGVTFCALLPMRSIPFRVICLVGMNDGSFPRVRRASSFDLIAASPQPGDRQLHQEDRQVFLETLLSAREHLLITYVGRSVRDNTVLPPSVVMAELLDAFDRPRPGQPRGGMPEYRPHAPPVVDHPLQAFSPQAFIHPGGELPSYHRLGFEGAQALLESRGSRLEAAPFLSVPLPPLLDSDSSLPLEALRSFLLDPLGFLLTGRLGLELPRRFELVQDREPIELDALEQYELGELLLEQALTGREASDLEPILRATGRLPLGTPGACRFGDLWPTVTRILEALRPWQQGAKLPPAPFDLACDGVNISGMLVHLWERALVKPSYARVRARMELTAWLEHLVLQCVAPPGHPRRTVVVGRAEEGSGAAEAVWFRALPVHTARDLLADLARVFELGQRVPLPFFPESARVYATRVRELAGRPDAGMLALGAAQEKFRPSELGRAFGEAERASVALVFGEREPLSPGFRVFPGTEALEPPSFVALAERIYGPLLDALEPAE